VSWAAAAA